MIDATEDDGSDEHGLAGKVAMITGGASGIGQALAFAYARSGVRTVIGYYPDDPHDPQVTVDGVAEAGGQCLAVSVDVRLADQVDALADEAIKGFGRLDIAVAGAGILRGSRLDELTDDRWGDLLDIDLTGVLRTFRAAAGRMSGPGAMVAISSIAGGVYGWQEHAHYATAKAGVVGLCRSLALELAPRGIRVNTVIPGLIETPQSLDETNAFGPQGLITAGNAIPAGRVGTADDVARVIRFLTSDDAAYVTGVEIVADGGLKAQMPL